jgi:hypothetical protein
MNEESMKASGDLIRWLKMLALPKWAKFGIATIMILIIGSALSLLSWGLINSKLDVISSAVAILTVGLPVGLIVVALVFGDGGAGKLKDLTKLVLLEEVPDAILQNMASTSGHVHYKNPKLIHTLNGCIADYVLSAEGYTENANSDGRALTFEFRLELNVRKANLVVWIPLHSNVPDVDPGKLLAPYESCFFGAVKEGYIQNTTPLQDIKQGHVGFVFIRVLGDDFLLNPGERLYFAQDLAFFVRGLVNVELQHG